MWPRRSISCAELIITLTIRGILDRFLDGLGTMSGNPDAAQWLSDVGFPAV
jgi:hypothetical protein